MIRIAAERFIVSHHKNSGIQTFQKPHHILCSIPVKIPCRLIRKNQLRLCYERTRHRNSLLFSAGQIHRQMCHSLTQSNHVQCFFHHRASEYFINSPKTKWKLNIFKRSHNRNQSERLKYKSNFIHPQIRTLTLCPVRCIHAIPEIFTGIGSIQHSQQIQKRTLSAAGCSIKNTETFIRNIKGNAFQHIQCSLLCPERFPYLFQLYHFHPSFIKSAGILRLIAIYVPASLIAVSSPETAGPAAIQHQSAFPAIILPVVLPSSQINVKKMKYSIHNINI